jgi:hypothetical protein
MDDRSAKIRKMSARLMVLIILTVLTALLLLVACGEVGSVPAPPPNPTAIGFEEPTQAVTPKASSVATVTTAPAPGSSEPTSPPTQALQPPDVVPTEATVTVAAKSGGKAHLIFVTAPG